jgi:subfamily B ATP-binding cassette protein MsbA
LLVSIGCMVLYAATSAVSLGMVVPLMGVLFERMAPGHGVSAPAIPGVHAPAATPSRTPPDRLSGWPTPLRRVAEGAFLKARPRVALERICIFILVVLLLKNLSDYLQSFLMVSVEQAAVRDLRSALFAHLHTLPLSFFQGRRTGMLVSRLTNDVDFLRASLAAGISNFIKDSLTLAGCVAWIVIASWKLALLSIIVLPPAAFLVVRIGRSMRRRSDQTQERMGDMTNIVQETITGARVVKAFGMEGYESGRFDRANHRFYRAFVRLRRVSAAARPVSEYTIVLVAVAMLWFGGQEIMSGAIAPQQFVLFVTALLTTISPIKTLSEVHANVQQGVAAAERVFAVMDTPPAIQDRPGAVALGPLRGAVRYESVDFAYGPDRRVLEHVTFEIRKGEIVALVGSSGSGKSTAMDLLARFHDASGGRVTYDGVDLRDAEVSSLRAQLGIVTQETLLFHDTVRANIRYGRAGASDEDIRAAARAAHAHEWIERLPDGYDTVIGERGTRLSGGERQRLAIARAVLRNPPILLLDEATSALDTESERLVQSALERLMENRTVLVIAHRLSTVQHADRIVVLEHGHVVATGTHAELLEQGGLYRRLYDLQFVA